MDRAADLPQFVLGLLDGRVKGKVVGGDAPQPVVQAADGAGKISREQDRQAERQQQAQRHHRDDGVQDVDALLVEFGLQHAVVQPQPAHGKRLAAHFVEPAADHAVAVGQFPGGKIVRYLRRAGRHQLAGSLRHEQGVQFGVGLQRPVKQFQVQFHVQVPLARAAPQPLDRADHGQRPRAAVDGVHDPHLAVGAAFHGLTVQRLGQDGLIVVQFAEGLRRGGHDEPLVVDDAEDVDIILHRGGGQVGVKAFLRVDGLRLGGVQRAGNGAVAGAQHGQIVQVGEVGVQLALQRGQIDLVDMGGALVDDVVQVAVQRQVARQADHRRAQHGQHDQAEPQGMGKTQRGATSFPKKAFAARRRPGRFLPRGRKDGACPVLPGSWRAGGTARRRAPRLFHTDTFIMVRPGPFVNRRPGRPHRARRGVI